MPEAAPGFRIDVLLAGFPRSGQMAFVTTFHFMSLKTLFMVLGQIPKSVRDRREVYTYYVKHLKALHTPSAPEKWVPVSPHRTHHTQRHSQRPVPPWRKVFHYRAVPRQSNGFANRRRQYSSQGGLRARHGLRRARFLPLFTMTHDAT